MVEPENREAGFSCSNGITFSGSRDGAVSLKTEGCVDADDRRAGREVKPENQLDDKP